VEPLLVGRAEELQLLRAGGRRLIEGYGSFVHVVGEAGIGKSSLLSTLADDLRDLGIDLRTAAADETDRRRRSALARALLPEADFEGTIDPVDVAVAAVEQLVARGPVALLADDLHWADEASLDALRALGRRAGDLGLLVVTTSRPRESAATGRLEELARAEAVCLRLSPLDAAHLDELVEHRFGAPPGAELRSLLGTTAGNPFLVDELLTGLDQAGRLGLEHDELEVKTGTEVPVDVSDRLASRAIVALPGGELLLRAMAAVPGGVTTEELTELLDQPVSAVVELVLEGVRSGLIVDTGTALTFHHELIRRSVLDSTPSSVSRALARSAANVLLARGADPERITACLLAAELTDPGDADHLIDVSSGFRASHPSAAADLLTAALRALSIGDPRLPDLTKDLGWSLVAAGRAGEVEPLLREWIGPFRDDEPTAIHRLRGIAASLTGRLDIVAGRYASVDVDSVTSRAEAADPDFVDAFAELALLRVSMGRMAEARAIVDWAEASPTPATPFRTATVAMVRSWLAAVEGSFEAAAAQARLALTWVERDSTRSATPATPSLTLAVALDQLGDSDGALAVTRGPASVMGIPRWGPPLLQFFTGVTLYRRGDWDDALAEVDAGLVAADEADLGMGVVWPYSVATLVALARGQHQLAREWLDRVPSSAQQPSLGSEWLLYAAAGLAEAEGDHGPAAGLIELVVSATTAAGAPALLLNGGPDMARIALDAERPDLAERIADELTALAGRTSSRLAAAHARWSRALVEGAVEPVAAAASELAAIGRVPESARAAHHAAVLAVAAGDHAAARRLGKLAFAGYEELGAEHWRRQLRSELRARGLVVRPRRQRVRPTSGWESLTESEQAVVALVAEGLTNTEVAERLYVSRRTVESHLGRVYAKLGLGTRAHLVAAANRPRVDTGDPVA
jgi:DNA-binding CsgD family transcriptional regulator